MKQKTLYIIAGCIENLFNIYLPIVDSWMLVENHSNPRVLIADGGFEGTNIYIEQLFNKMHEYVGE